jgi:type IV secretory pathway VirJ component
MLKILKYILFFVLGMSLIILIFAIHKVDTNHTKFIVQAYRDNNVFKKDNLSDLPLLQYKATNNSKDYFVILFPGDGGWRDVIGYISNDLANHGINVVGFNTIPYFNRTREPKEIAKDIQRVITNFSAIWHKDSVIIGGYSFGAEIMPFVYNQLDSACKKKVIKIIMLGPSNLADFKVSPIYYYDKKKGKSVIKEMETISPDKFIVFCDKYKESICKSLPSSAPYKVIKVPYGHLFIGHFSDVSTIMRTELLHL